MSFIFRLNYYFCRQNKTKRMKKLLTVVLFSFLAMGASYAQNDNGIIGKARGAANECLKPFSGNDWEVNASVNTTGICFVSGFIQEVIFTARPVNQVVVTEEGGHAPALPIVIAVVQIGCGGEVIYTTCY